MKQLQTVICGAIAFGILLSSSALHTEAIAATRSGPAVGGDHLMRPIAIKGQVLCTNCRLEDVRAEQLGGDLYLLTHERGTMVFKLTWVNDRHLWHATVSPSQLRVRTASSVFQQLTSEQYARHEVQLSGYLSGTQTFDIGQVVWLDSMRIYA